MGKVYSAIDEKLRAFIEAQQMFFVATAPSNGGHVNLSPKGLNALRILGPTTVAYIDHIGSGIETIAHLRENHRLCLCCVHSTARRRLCVCMARGRRLNRKTKTTRR